MHQLIRVLSKAHSREDATGIAQMLFEGMDPALVGPYDYGKTMDEGGRWGDEMPDGVQETGSIEATSEFGQEQIEKAWKATLAEFRRNMAVIRKAVDEFDDEEILEDPMVEDVEVEPWNPLGLAQSEDDLSTEYSSYVRLSMNEIGSYRGPAYYLYNEDGRAIRDRSTYERITESIESGTDEDDLNWYLTPVDVHY